MSTHAIPVGTDTDLLFAIVGTRLRPPRRFDAAELEFAPDLTAEEQTTLAAIFDRCASPTPEARALVLQTAQTAVGIRYDQLTAAQVRALAAILFWQAGALKADGTVRPLAQWVRD